MAARDDDDWVGTPPEGHHTRDRADPGFWQKQWQPAAITGATVLVLALIVLVLVIL